MRHGHVKCGMWDVPMPDPVMLAMQVKKPALKKVPKVKVAEADDGKLKLVRFVIPHFPAISG